MHKEKMVWSSASRNSYSPNWVESGQVFDTTQAGSLCISIHMRLRKTDLRLSWCGGRRDGCKVLDDLLGILGFPSTRFSTEKYGTRLCREFHCSIELWRVYKCQFMTYVIRMDWFSRSKGMKIFVYFNQHAAMGVSRKYTIGSSCPIVTFLAC